MKNKLSIFSLLGILLTTNVYAESEIPLRAQIRRGEVLVTSKVDKIKITNIIVNRGSCKRIREDLVETAERIRGLNNKVRLPATLAFGQNFASYYPDNCVFLEVEVDTDQGDFLFSFD